MTQKFGPKTTADEVLAGVDLRNNRILITGVASGIGLETARALAAHGASIVGAVRDVAKGEAAVGSIREAAAQAGGTLDLLQLDLASLQSVRAAADNLLADGRPFDVIIANAGVMATPFSRTVDGFETQFGTNHLGHFALITRIAPLLADNGRLVVLSSTAHRASNVDLDDPNFQHTPYNPWVAYGRSKTANSLFAVEFDRLHRDRGVRAFAVMPGDSFTGLPRHLTEKDLQALFESVGKARADAGLPPAVLKSVQQAAATSVWAAAVANKDQIGGRYLENCAVAPVDDAPGFIDGVASYALDAESAVRLWAKSEEMVGAALVRLPQRSR